MKTYPELMTFLCSSFIGIVQKNLPPGLAQTNTKDKLQAVYEFNLHTTLGETGNCICYAVAWQ